MCITIHSKNTFFIGLLLYLNKLADIMTDRNDYLDNLPGHFKDYAGPSQVFSNQIEVRTLTTEEVLIPLRVFDI